jgi:U3 small nucleolar RNA-associated protein 10
MLEAFDLRRHIPNSGSDDDCERTLSLVDSIAMDLTLKLNDATFRPFFMRVVDWAENGLPKSDVDGRTLRMTSLYSFSLTFFEQLKSLVTSYASFLLDSAARVLQQPASNDASERELLEIVLQTLSSSFRHDQDDFWQTPSHFDAIATPLLSQLKNARAIQSTDYIVPTITDFAAAASSPEHLKALNGTLMSYMKDPDTTVRLAAVKCERNITERLSLEWLTLLPEMLPVISELMEDDSEEVEREVLGWVKEIEEATGESLEGMLA